MLRTCSLPDLTSLVLADEGGDSMESLPQNVPEGNEAVVVSNQGEDPCNSDNNDEDVFYDSVGDLSAVGGVDEDKGVGGPSGEETKGVGQEAGFEGEGQEISEEEEEWSSSEDEDLQELVKTLQNFVEEASEFASEFQ